MSRFTRYAWFVLAYNIAVVLWGAYVRATGSGAGCGEHWPLCNGVVLPRAPQIATLIEFTHRITSGLALVFVAILAVAAIRQFPKGHRARLAAILSLVFTLTEGLIGAALVLLGHVAANTSLWRGVTLSLHLTNTLILLAVLALAAWWSSERPAGRRLAPAFPHARAILTSCAVFLLVVGISGAIAALGDTLFASSTLAEGMRADLSPSSHPFVQLRVLHPVFAVLLAVTLLGITLFALRTSQDPGVRRLAGLVATLVVMQVALGITNLVLLAPVALQIVHLLFADLLWISLVLFSAEVLVSVPAPASDPRPQAALRVS